MSLPVTCLTAISFLSLLKIRVESAVPVKYSTLGMDDATFCHENNIWLEKLLDGNGVVVVARSKASEKGTELVTECQLRISPSSANEKQHLLLTFDTFHFPSCDKTLTILQSPSPSFDNTVSTLMRLTCRSQKPPPVILAKGYSLQLDLKMTAYFVQDYNFRLNITLSDQAPEEEQLSIGITVGIIVICAIAITMGCFILRKYLMMRKESVNTGHSRNRTVQFTTRGDSRNQPHEDGGTLCNGNGNHQTSDTGAADSYYMWMNCERADRNEAENHSDDDTDENTVDRRNHHRRRQNGHSRSSDNNDSILLEDNEEVIDEAPPSYDEAVNMPIPGTEYEQAPNYQNINPGQSGGS